MKNFILAITATALVAGCEQYQPITSPPAKFTSQAGVRPIKVVKTHPVELRTFTKASSGKTVEVVGARCSAMTNRLQTSVVTPAFLKVPQTQGNDGPMRINCSTGKAFVSVQEPAELPLNDTSPAGASGGIAAMIATATIQVAIAHAAKRRDQWTYLFNTGGRYKVTFR